VQLLQESAGSTASSGCVAEQVDRLRAFGSAPRRLSSVLRRSFIAARNFVHGLVVGRDTVAALASVSCCTFSFFLFFVSSPREHNGARNSVCLSVRHVARTILPTFSYQTIDLCSSSLKIQTIVGGTSCLLCVNAMHGV